MAMVLPAVISGCNVKPQSACEDGSSSQFTAVADVMDGRLLTKLLCLAHTKPHLFQGMYKHPQGMYAHVIAYGIISFYYTILMLYITFIHDF